MTNTLNFDRHINLADETIGAEATFATDDFFCRQATHAKKRGRGIGS